MADAGVTWELQGLDELGRRLNELATSMRKKVSGRATAAAARVVKTKAVQNAPVVTDQRGVFFFKGKKINVVPGNLKKSIIMKRVRLNKSLTSEHIVTVRTTPSAKGPGAFYGRFVEFGTVKMAPEPFMRPAILSEKERAVTEMTTALRNGIEQQAAKS